MELIESFEAGAGVQRVERAGRSALLLAVVHDGYARVNAVNEGWAGALIPAMVRDDQDVHVSELVAWAHELHLLVPGEVAEIDELELAEVDFDAEGAGVLRLVSGLGGRGLAGFVGLACARERVGDQGTIGADDGGVEALDG